MHLTGYFKFRKMGITLIQIKFHKITRRFLASMTRIIKDRSTAHSEVTFWIDLNTKHNFVA